MLKVMYPEGGERVLLHWRADHVGGRVSVLRSLSQVQDMVRIILEKEDSPFEVLNFCLVELVAPNDQMHNLFHSFDMRRKTQEFYEEVVSKLQKNPEAVPRPFVRCPHASSERWDCELCGGDGLCLEGMDKDALFAKYSSGWYKIFSSRRAVVDRGSESRARFCSHGKESLDIVEFATLREGPHQPGVVFQRFNQNPAVAFLSTPLFFFQRVLDVDPAPIEAKVAAWVEDARQEKVGRYMKAVALQDLQKKREQQEIVLLFKEE